MDQKSKAAFLVLVLLQAVHSVEEYAFKFYEVFPPAQWLNQAFPGIARPGFVAFNIFLMLFGLWCFFRRVVPSSLTARLWAWVWVTIELYNGIAHPAWAVAIRGYNPGLATSPLLFAVALYLALRLRGSGRRAPSQAAS